MSNDTTKKQLPPCPNGCDPHALERIAHTASVTITCHLCGLRAPESTWNRLAASHRAEEGQAQDSTLRTICRQMLSHNDDVVRPHGAGSQTPRQCPCCGASEDISGDVSHYLSCHFQQIRELTDEAIAIFSAPVEVQRCGNHCGHNAIYMAGGVCIAKIQEDNRSGYRNCNHRCDFSRPAPPRNHAAARRAAEKIADEYKELLTTPSHLMHSKVPAMELSRIEAIIESELTKD